MSAKGQDRDPDIELFVKVDRDRDVIYSISKF